jgi:hypothetical protein
MTGFIYPVNLSDKKEKHRKWGKNIGAVSKVCFNHKGRKVGAKDAKIKH